MIVVCRVSGSSRSALLMNEWFLTSAKPKVISEALGHSSVAFTVDVYSHIIEGMQSEAMALLDEILPEAKNGVSGRINANLTPRLDIMLNRN